MKTTKAQQRAQPSPVSGFPAGLLWESSWSPEGILREYWENTGALLEEGALRNTYQQA